MVPIRTFPLWQEPGTSTSEEVCHSGAPDREPATAAGTGGEGADRHVTLDTGCEIDYY